MRGAAQHLDRLDHLCVVAESRANTVAEGFLVLFGRDNHGDVASGRWERRHVPPGFQGEHLSGDPRVAGTQVADVRNRLAQHERAFEAHAERQS